jgi:hypothetical protein
MTAASFPGNVYRPGKKDVIKADKNKGYPATNILCYFSDDPAGHMIVYGFPVFLRLPTHGA